MRYIRKGLVVSLLSISAALASLTHQEHEEVSNWQRFSALLDDVDDATLHRVLHTIYPKYKDGVFNKDRHAVEQVHSENPTVASKLVYIAKRQSNNGTIPTQPTSTSSTIEQTSDASSFSSRSIAVSSAISSILSAELTATSVPPPTTVYVPPAPPTSATPIRTGTDGVVFSNSGGSLVTLTSSPVNIRFTPITSTRTFYTTLSDGQVQTITTTIIVNEAVTDEPSPTSSTPTSTPGLQNGAVVAAPPKGLSRLMIGALGFLAAI